ncbi:MAG TPA: VOC family protein, partial [Bryobacteraceae bacterium]|nr:VOC family protein [Bryobacteraceae bacterium]
MDMKLEVVVLPVSDVDRAKLFYEKLGFRLDIDFTANEHYRVLQFTPPGSEASIIFGKGVTSARPGSIDRLLLAVHDIEAARAQILSHGAAVSEVFHDAGGSLGAGFIEGTDARAPGPDPQRRSYGSYASFSDPDGNVWLLQEIRERLPGRVTQRSVNGNMTSILLEALKSAAAAHGVHETQLGAPDSAWPEWYAEHMTRTLSG